MNMHLPQPFDVEAYCRNAADRDHRLGKDAKPGPTEREMNRTIFAYVRPDANEHVAAWKAWQRINDRFTTPADFIKAHCFIAGLPMHEIVGPCLKRHYAFRVSLLRSVMARYPKLKTPQLGMLFNRHHTSILRMLGRTGSSKARAAE